MNGNNLFRLITFWMMHMADIFKHVLISGEMAYLSEPLRHPEPSEGPPVIQEVPHWVRDDVSLAREDGYSQGLTDGIAQENARLHEQFNTLDVLLHSIPEAISENRRQLSAEIADIVLLITHKLFINQQQNKESIRHQITQIIDELNNKQNIEIALHPRELALIEQYGIEIDTQACKNLTLLPDVSLRLGGCIVKSEHGVFDAGIERQIDNLKQVLLQMRGLDE